MDLIRKLLSTLTPPKTIAELEYVQTCERRRPLDNGEIYETYYSNTEVTRNTCTRVLDLLRMQLDLPNIRPEDNVAIIFDIDIGHICFEVEEEFRIEFSKTNYHAMDGTVDSIIRTTEELRPAKAE